MAWTAPRWPTPRLWGRSAEGNTGMAAAYRHLLNKIRLAFPQPVSDRVHDSYFVHSIMRALDQVDEMKSQLPFLGQLIPPDYEAARHATLRPHLASVDEVTS